jgi:hypothetical protein
VPVQDVALVELQVSVEAAPLTTDVGFAVKEAVGSPRIVTVAVAAVLVPPGPVQVSEYVVLAVSAPVGWLPLVAFAPAKVPPVAVHDVALVELHVSVEVPPLAIEVGLAVSVAVGSGAMVTVADAAVLVPPAPVHVNEYAVLAVKAPVLWLPLVALVPVHPPEAVHDAALVELQVSVEDWPLAIEVGLAVSVAVGTGAMVTMAEAAVLVPPAPVQVNEYVVVAVRAPVLWPPLVAFVPANVPPIAVHDVAFVELHVSVEDWPLAMLVGFAFNVAVGMVPIVTVAVAGALVPPVPVQVSVYAVLVVNAPVFTAPLADFVPLQPPEAVQDVALVELQVSVEDPPLAIVVGLDLSVTVGAGAIVTVADVALLVPPAPLQVNE